MESCFQVIVRIFNIVALFLAGAFYALALPHDLKNGDLVFRDGDEVISEIIKQVDKSGFSHVGMLWISDYGVQVIHSTPSEHSNIKDGVTVDSLEFFISRAKPNSVRFYQVKGSEEARNVAVQTALERVGEKFSIYPGQGVYCTELVAAAWLKAGVSISTGSRKLDMPFISDNPLIFPENLINSENIFPYPQ
ncbi:YiiX/YebB-like N1pC/P60 family cysteine hydrolase [Proteus columbae]|uniref:YiiX/YebB-like N1pC/P60 family cysteine hydrolase n=1 Tax=Proteus columbae TaxID=1987580 RepID=UPI0028893642|nr:YiiX/YebB-like N1pC/P60 family cysteine hydrolase [Proteus columbae]